MKWFGVNTVVVANVDGQNSDHRLILSRVSAVCWDAIGASQKTRQQAHADMLDTLARIALH